MNPVEVKQGDSPVILALPHSGTFVPPEIEQRLSDAGKKLADTDWWTHRLYEGLLPDATTIRATFHRYVIDANRSPDNEDLYPGRNNTGLVSTITFSDEPLWMEGYEPDAADVAQRLALFHSPYHTALREQIARIRALHGIAIVYDCHSIRSQMPFLFEGTLPELNIGTFDGASCDPALAAAVTAICGDQSHYRYIVDGRFKGGWTTRHYGRPHEGVHAIQMEITQRCYLVSESAPFDYDPEKAQTLRELLARLLAAIEDIALHQKG